ncbi:MAG: CDP-glycerol glycerophosphotransferase family protein [Microcella pacifica]
MRRACRRGRATTGSRPCSRDRRARPARRCTPRCRRRSTRSFCAHGCSPRTAPCCCASSLRCGRTSAEHPPRSASSATTAAAPLALRPPCSSRSFYSQTVACNPLAIDRELARIRPDVTRYWSVVDRSIAVPGGAVPIVEGSAEWWRVRADARVLVVNDWLRKRWMPRPHQTVLQTWHGTMLKRLALDRDRVGLRTRIAVRRESARWSILLAQNEYAASILRRAYAFRGPLWVEGYPRSDTLIAGDRAGVRARLGLQAQDRAVLYAPTWRDDRTELVDYLDLPSFAAELRERDPRAVLVVRGHSRTLRFGRDLEGPGIIDATTYPDVADLLLAANVVVTDYSSIMFDLAATDTPVILFTPDLDRYADELRGFYFDVTTDAPGPVVASRDALLDAIDASSSGTLPSQRAAWRERFTPLDDGRAGERVVARILAEGLLD